MSVPETIRAAVARLREAAEVNSVVKLTPDAALAVAEMIEMLAARAGIQLADSADQQP